MCVYVGNDESLGECVLLTYLELTCSHRRRHRRPKIRVNIERLQTELQTERPKLRMCSPYRTWLYVHDVHGANMVSCVFLYTTYFVERFISFYRWNEWLVYNSQTHSAAMHVNIKFVRNVPSSSSYRCNCRQK